MSISDRQNGGLCPNDQDRSRNMHYDFEFQSDVVGQSIYRLVILA